MASVRRYILSVMSNLQPHPSDHLPDMERPVRHRSIRSGAEVHRDAWGVPHIRSDDLYDLFFAQGYATAQDRLWQMDQDRMGGLGRFSEYVGQKAAYADGFMRRRDFARVAKADYEVCSEDAKAALDAYADGVNAFIKGPDPLPYEHVMLETVPEPWEPWHSIVVYKLSNSAQGSMHSKVATRELVARLGVEKYAKLAGGYLPGMYLTVPPGAEFDGATQNAIEELKGAIEELNAAFDSEESETESDFGSNGWAISGDLTESGLPMVGGDSHRQLDLPNIYYQTHLTHPDFDVLGHTIPGMPMVMHFAHNRHVAWGMTHGGCDTQDLFLEEIRYVGDNVQYLFKGEWLDAESHTEEIRVHDPSQPDGFSVSTVEVVRTHHGMVIEGQLRKGFGIVLADPGSEDGTPWVDATLSAMRSRNADEFESALDGWTDRVNNYVYADVHGEFGYCLKGRVPMRAKANGWVAVPGWTGEYDWQGFIPPHQLPRVRNPETGWVVSCNQRVIGDDYPFWLATSFGPDYRARRIISHIQRHIDEGTKIDLATMREFHADSVSIPALQFKQWLDSVWPRIESGELYDNRDIVEVARSLREWDGDMTWSPDSESPGRSALYFKIISISLAVKMIANGYGGSPKKDPRPYEYDHYRRNIKPTVFKVLASGDASLGWQGFNVEAMAIDAIEEATATLNGLEPTRGPMSWKSEHTVRQNHKLVSRFPELDDELGVLPISVAGDEDVPLATSNSTLGDFQAQSGPVNRYLHDPSNWSNGRWIVPLGASGNSASPHFTDQRQKWADVEYIPQLYEWDEITANAESVQEFRPVS